MDEVYDLLNYLDDLRKNNPSIFHHFDNLYLVLEIFFKNLGYNLKEQFLNRITDALKNYLKGFIKGEVNSKMLEINLKFILELTNNNQFMIWLKNLKFNMFKLMKNNKKTSHITNDIMILANKVHHNLLKNYTYSAKFLFNA
jgi:hypothetical protein